MPGGGRNVNFEYVWKAGKAPRYLTRLALSLLLFLALWAINLYFLVHSATTVSDSLHSVTQMGEKGTLYFPWPQYWFAYVGVYVALGWMFVLGIIMAFHRKRQWKKNP